MVNHIIYEGRGSYEPRPCPKVILWQRLPDNVPPDICVYVDNIEDARSWGDVTVIMDNTVVMSLLQREEER